MRTRGLALVVGTLSVALMGAAAEASFNTPQRKCRDTIAKDGEKLAKIINKTLIKCHKNNQKFGASVDCRSVSGGPFGSDPKGKVAKAEAKLLSRVGGANDKCANLGPPSLTDYESCPAPCTNVIDDYADVATCISCLAHANAEGLTEAAQGMPSGIPLDKDEADCHATVGKDQGKHYQTIIKERRKCQAAAEKNPPFASDTSSCENQDPKGRIGKKLMKGMEKIANKCASADLGQIDSCSDVDVNSLNTCLFADSSVRGEEFFEQLYALGDGGVTTTTQPPTTTTNTTNTTSTTSTTNTTNTTNTTVTTSTTTTTLPAQDAQCPDRGILRLWSGTGIECTTNADCIADGSPGDCDTGIGRCTTASELDTGFTGIGHDADISEDVFVSADIVCPGPAPTCGECVVAGINPAVGNCRCAGDNRSVCDEPFVADADDCGGGICNCYFGTLLSLSAGNVPVCVVNRFREDVTGTANVDTGDGLITAALRSEVYTGELNVKPCPVCGATCTGPTDGRCTAPFVKRGDVCNADVDCDDAGGDGVCQFSFGDSCATDIDCDINIGDGVGSCGGSAICTAPASKEGDPCTSHAQCDVVPGDGVCGTFDATAGDGARGGTCHLGRDDGSSCDVDGVSRIFPAGNGFAGGGYSLDCFPEVGRNVSGAGLVIDLIQTTGSASMDANVDCGAVTGGPAGEDCFCAVCSRACSLDTGVDCDADVDCQRCSLDPSGPVCGTDLNCRRCSAASSNAGAACFVNVLCPGGCCETQETTCSLLLSKACETNADCGVGEGTCTGVPGGTGPTGTCAGPGGGVCDNSALGTCLGESNFPCNSDADCSAIGGFSTCTSAGAGEPPFPNKCDPLGTGGNGTVGLCTDSGGGEGECADAGDELFSCDGVTRPNGEGFISCDPTTKCDDLGAAQCTDNNDCAMGIECVSDLECRESTTGIPGGAGDCTVAKRRSCFVDPIAATGVMDANEPLGVATFCIPPTAAGPAINKVAGLPGPGRVRTQATSTIICAGAPHGCASNNDCAGGVGICSSGDCLYVPGAGGCP